MSLKISKDFELPNNAVTKTMAIIAKKGAGKTYTAGVIEEEFAKNGIPFVVIDPMGHHWGIKSKYPVYIFGGKNADVPISPEIGREVAQTIVKMGISVVIDISSFSKSEQRRFVHDFCDELFKINETPRHLFLEEAPEFVPQIVRQEDAKVFSAIDRLVRLGRGKGIGITLIGQRSAKINKDVLSQIDLLFILRTTWKADVDVFVDLMKDTLNKNELEEFKKNVQKLPTGWAYVWSPEWLGVFKLIKIRKRETFDSSKTPELGEIRNVRLVRVDATKLAEEFSRLIEEKKEERRKIKELEKELQKRDRIIERLKSQVDDLNYKLEILELVGKKLGVSPKNLSPEVKKEIIGIKEEEIRKLREYAKALEEKNKKLEERIKELEKDVSLLERIRKIIEELVPVGRVKEKVVATPTVVLKKKYQERVVERILKTISSLTKRQKDIAMWVNFVWGKQINRKGIARHLLGWKSSTSELNADVRLLIDKELLREDFAGRIYPNIENIIRSELKIYDASEEEIVNTIERIKEELAKED